MARTVKDAKLETPSARAKLAARHEPYWKAIDGGMHIGYRKGKLRASWLARYRGEDGRYRKSVLGIPDDVQDATDDKDTSTVLTFSQAQEKAREWFQTQRDQENGKTNNGPYTVASARDDYLKWFANNSIGIGTARSNFDNYIIPEIGDVEVASLTLEQIEVVRDKIANSPAQLRSRPGADQNFRKPPKNADERRQRKATANRALSTLKACLNHAYHRNRVASDSAWRRA